MFEIIWQEFNRKARVITKCKHFRSYPAMVKFMDKIEGKDNFWQIIGYID